MIYCNSKTYARVWKVTPANNGKYIDLQITTSEKDMEDNYVNSSWFPRCIGKSVNTLKGVKREDRIIISKCKFTNERYTAEDGSTKSRFRLIILEAEIERRTEGGSAQANTQPAAKTQPKDNIEAEEDCPW